jgi:3-hydroxybutyryl-CoA dehydrogenase
MGGSDGYARPGIVGSGTIGCGLAACASRLTEVWLFARSDSSAWRAEESAQAQARKVEGGVAERIKVTTDRADLGDCDLAVEAIVEDHDTKVAEIASLARDCPGADLASTTSSLSIHDLADHSDTNGRMLGLHVFNPVIRMELIELCLPRGLPAEAGARAHAWCAGIGKTAIEVADQAGFVVNRLLFPLLFEAVRLMEQTEMQADDVDACMRLGAGHPMGPLKLLDFVGLDVAAAIGASLHADSGRESDQVPDRIHELIAAGKLGRKSGAGFYEY